MKFFITTPIYYVNDVPHIGHTYCTIATDILARFKRLQGYDVLFSTGTDEHGQKAENSAKQKKMKSQDYVNEMSEVWKNLWIDLNISFSDFIRTTDKKHCDVVQYIFNKMSQSGDIYLGIYEGWYCTPCESFWLQSQLKEGKCPNEWCQREVSKVKEENYFFRLSKYQSQLLNYYDKMPNSIKPKERYNEVISFIKSGLEDICISRLSLEWGIPIPFDKKYIIYVWFDALINYLTVCGYIKDEEKFKKFWPADVHIIGKDIIRFHCVIWPAMLVSLGLPPPKLVFAHGFWNVDGEKMSKSKGNFIEPRNLIEELSSELNIDKYLAFDVIRYFLIREVPFGQDGNFSKQSLISRYNADLANDFGNLLHRTLPMIERYFEGIVPSDDRWEDTDKNFKESTLNSINKVESYLEDLEISLSLSEIWKIVQSANKYIEVSAPWNLEKDKDKRLSTVIYNLTEVLYKISYLIEPFMPKTAECIRRQIGVNEDLKITYDKLKEWGNIKAGLKIRKEKPLFPREMGTGSFS